MTSLALYHDSQFSAFSTEVLVRMNQGTIAVVLLWPPELIERNARQQTQELGKPDI